MHFFNLTSGAWSRGPGAGTGGAPTARDGLRLATAGGRLLLFGGQDSAGEALQYF
jgi:hypothetical protein